MNLPCSSASFDKHTIERQLCFGWVGLNYRVKTGFTRKTKTILNNINGRIDFGTITAIMGPSGAGKTTLLKCISGRQTKAIDKNTNIYVNKDIEIKCCFIVQEVKEHLLNGLTTLQLIVYSSKLKNCRKGFNHELNARILLMSFNITNTANTCVDECSGGEQKRIAIALELTAEDKPNLLCIDEPTSGLDSCAAEGMIQCLKNLSVNNGISVVTSIHQPNQEIMSQFDKLYVMSVGGQCVFDGHPNEMSEYLERIDISLSGEEVPIEVIIKMSSKVKSEETLRIIDMVRSRSGALEQRCSRDGVLSVRLHKKKFRFSFRQTWYLTVRTVIHIIRYRLWSDITHFFIMIFIALVLPYTFEKDISRPIGCLDPLHLPDLCNQSTKDLIDDDLITENSGLFCYISCIIMCLISITGAMMFTNEIPIFFVEHSNGWYSTGSYFLAKTMVELPKALVFGISFTLIIYKGSHQIDESFRLWSFVGIAALVALTAQGYGLAISTVTNSSQNLACLISLAFFIFYTTLSPFISWGWNESLDWLRYLSYANQGEQSFLYLIYGFDRCPEGLTPRALWHYGIDDLNKFYLNIYILIFHLIVIRVVGSVLLLVMANKT